MPLDPQFVGRRTTRCSRASAALEPEAVRSDPLEDEARREPRQIRAQDGELTRQEQSPSTISRTPEAFSTTGIQRRNRLKAWRKPSSATDVMRKGTASPALPLPQTGRPRPHRDPAHPPRAARAPRAVRPAPACAPPPLPRRSGPECQVAPARRRVRQARATGRGPRARRRCRLPRPSLRPHRPASAGPSSSRASTRCFRSCARRVAAR